ncbi:MAG: TlpA disulfide reductase family protein [Ignavibacteriae bacterium]|jgi:peroxiredoxin|nr:TlpA disulfide reductase family protein [Ignavibacteriota bacterium]
MKLLLTILVLVFINSSQIFAQYYTDFAGEDINGNEIKLGSYIEKGPVMLGFWRSWCPSCKEEQRNMQILYEKYKQKGFSYIGVNIDNQKSVSKVKSYVSTMGFTFPVILDTDKKIFEMYGGSEDAVPYYLIIGKDKNVLHTHLGYKSGDEKMIEDEIKEALGIR